MHIHWFKNSKEIQTAKGVMAGFDSPIMRQKLVCRCGKVKYISLTLFVSDKYVNDNSYNWN